MKRDFSALAQFGTETAFLSATLRPASRPLRFRSFYRKGRKGFAKDRKVNYAGIQLR
jgi:hypothetical protein